MYYYLYKFNQTCPIAHVLRSSMTANLLAELISYDYQIVCWRQPL